MFVSKRGRLVKLRVLLALELGRTESRCLGGCLTGLFVSDLESNYRWFLTLAKTAVLEAVRMVIVRNG
jgi:hypothetical protein